MRSRAVKYRKRKGASIIIFILLCLAFLCLIKILSVPNQSLMQSEFSNMNVEELNKNDTYSEYIILIDSKSGTTLFSKNENHKCYPASLTKIMTAIIAIENNDDLDKSIVLENDVFKNLRYDNASVAGYNEGENTNIRDLLYGSILASGADASIGLAIATSGSTEKFVKLMNEKAKELNMKSTHFTNPTGLHNDKQVTTAKDMSLLLKYALKNSDFKKIFKSQSHEIKTDNRKFTVYSTFYSNYNGSEGYKVLGAKTGTTSEAGSCLASWVKIRGNKFILITMNAPLSENEQPYSFDDLDYIFNTIRD